MKLLIDKNIITNKITELELVIPKWEKLLQEKNYKTLYEENASLNRAKIELDNYRYILQNSEDYLK